MSLLTRSGFEELRCVGAMLCPECHLRSFVSSPHVTGVTPLPCHHLHHLHLHTDSAKSFITSGCLPGESFSGKYLGRFCVVMGNPGSKGMRICFCQVVRERHYNQGVSLNDGGGRGEDFQSTSTRHSNNLRIFKALLLRRVWSLQLLFLLLLFPLCVMTLFRACHLWC